jgi:ATP-dependent protease HslVU (ClpYQ) peptidase subunit
MEKNISELLKAATKDILTEDVLKEIESAFESSVDDKVKLHVEKALNEQDEDYANKLETLLEAVDADHTAKLNKVVSALDADRAKKLKAIVSKYEMALTTEASNFKGTMIDQVSNYLELYLEEKLVCRCIVLPLEQARLVRPRSRAFSVCCRYAL